MGRIATLLAVLVVLGLTQALPKKQDPTRARIIQLLKKNLGGESGNGPFGESGSGPHYGESGSGPHYGESGSGPHYGGSGPHYGESGSGPYNGGPGVPPSSCNEPIYTQLDLEHLEYYFTLPFSNFMADTVIGMMYRPIPSISELRDTVWFDPRRAGEAEMVFSSMNHIRMNPQTFATAMTMETVPMLMNGRMHCPSTVLNIFTMQLWTRELFSNILNYSPATNTFYTAARAVFPPFENMPAELERFVQACATEMSGAILNDTAKMTMALELKDVAVASHQLYYNFYHMKSGFAPTTTTHMMTMFNNTVMEAGVRCHTGNELFGQHSFVTRMFMNDWEDMEIEDVCYHVGSFFYEYIAREAINMPNIDINSLDDIFQWEQLHPMCEWIRGFIHSEVFPTLDRFRILVQQQNTGEFMNMFNYLGEGETRVLEEVLVRLGWPRPGTSPTTTNFNNVRRLRNPFKSRKWVK